MYATLCGNYFAENEGGKYLYDSDNKGKVACADITWIHALPTLMPLMFSNGKLSRPSPKVSAFILLI